MREWLEDPRGKAVFAPTFEQIKARMAATIGAGDDGGEAIGMDMMGFMMEMPLLSLLHFQEEGMPRSADETVEDLLAQVHGR